YGVIDALKQPLEQGLLPYSYDLIVAANVMHNAEDPAAALARLRPLLAESGVILLIERTRNTRAQALTVGFIDGLSSLETAEDAPFLPLSSWVSALEAAGFAEVATGRDQSEGKSDLGLNVVLARAGAPSPTERSRSLALAA